MKTSLKEKNNKHQYGLLSMLALIVGSVIGSGIYVVNDKLYVNSGHSTGLSMLVWILITLVVVFMLIAFIEVVSITSKKGEAGTVNNWTRHLWGEKYSRYIGVFMPLINVTVTLSAYGLIMSGELLNNFDKFSTIDSNSEIWMAYLYGTLIAFLFINLIYLMNALTTRPGKIFQTSGTIIKCIPLFTLTFLGLLVITGAIIGGSSEQVLEPNHVFDFAHPDKDMNSFIILLLLTPTIMFSYDGFIAAASLQSETKKRSTYKIALVSGMTFVFFVYLIVTYFSYRYGTPGDNYGFSVTSTIGNIFPNQKWISLVISIAIMISILTGLSGSSISQNRMLADLSASNVIADKNGKLLTRNRALVPQNAAIICWLATLGTFFIFRTLDLFALLTFIADHNRFADATYRDYSSFPIHSWAIDFVTLLSFSAYTFIIIGAIRNRFQEKVAVEKNKMFLPAASISVAMIALILLVFGYGLVVPGDFSLYSDTQNSSSLGLSIYRIFSYAMQIIVAFVIVALTFFLGWWFQKGVRKMQKKEKIYKAKLIKNYHAKKVDSKYYLKNIKFKNNDFFKRKYQKI